MNTLRDPFSLRNKPAFTILHQSFRTPLQTIQSEVSKAQKAALPAIETAVEKFDETLEKLDEAMSSFSIPKNVPSFTSPNREFEDMAWASAKGQSPRSPRGGGMSMANIAEGAVGGLFGRDRDLPLYKDKPYYKAGAQRQRKMWLRKRMFLLFSGVLFGLWWFGVFSASGVTLPQIPGREKKKGPADWNARRESVKEAFVQSWDAYEKHAWGNSSSYLNYLNHTQSHTHSSIPPHLTDSRSQLRYTVSNMSQASMNFTPSPKRVVKWFPRVWVGLLSTPSTPS